MIDVRHSPSKRKSVSVAAVAMASSSSSNADAGSDSDVAGRLVKKDSISSDSTTNTRSHSTADSSRHPYRLGYLLLPLTPCISLLLQ